MQRLSGESLAKSGGGIGVYGVTRDDPRGIGVCAFAPGEQGIGVYSYGGNAGVRSNSKTGTAIVAISEEGEGLYAKGKGNGIHAESDAASAMCGNLLFNRFLRPMMQRFTQSYEISEFKIRLLRFVPLLKIGCEN